MYNAASDHKTSSFTSRRKYLDWDIYLRYLHIENQWLSTPQLWGSVGGLRNSYTIRHRRENPIVKNKLPSESHCYSQTPKSRQFIQLVNKSYRQYKQLLLIEHVYREKKLL